MLHVISCSKLEADPSEVIPPPHALFCHLLLYRPRPSHGAKASWMVRQAEKLCSLHVGQDAALSATRHVAFLWDLASTATRLEAIAFRLEAIEAIAAFSDALERATCMSH